MAWTIDVAFVHAFENNVHNLAQEGADWIKGAARLKTGIRGKTYSIERIAGVEMVEITSRHQDTQLTPFTHTRRRLSLADYGLSEMLDDIDEVKMLISPESDYAANFAKSYNRRTAQTLFVAMNGNATAVANDDTTSNVALPSGQQIANGGTGMTMAKLRQANRIFDVNGIPAEDRWIAVSPYAIEDLLADAQVTSADYTTLRALMTGGIPDGSYFMGYKWKKITDALGAGAAMASPILPKTGNVRSCFAWHKNAMCLALARDFQVEMVRDPSKWNNLRVIVKVSQGAVRVEDEGVVKIDIDESV